jgi:hypothetical protein
MAEACQLVAQEYDTICGPECNPVLCDSGGDFSSPLSQRLNSKNVIVFDPDMSTAVIQAKFDEIWSQQVDDEMGSGRYVLYFEPGTYGSLQEPLMLQIGYYMEVAGLGAVPSEVVINGKVEVYNRCFEQAVPGPDFCVALTSFWRSLSNVKINVVAPTTQTECRKTAMFWAISQASSMRFVEITGGTLSLMDYCSGAFDLT